MAVSCLMMPPQKRPTAPALGRSSSAALGRSGPAGEAAAHTPGMLRTNSAAIRKTEEVIALLQAVWTGFACRALLGKALAIQALAERTSRTGRRKRRTMRLGLVEQRGIEPLTSA